MEDCNSCPCGCRPISEDCVTKFSIIKDPTILSDANWQFATDDMDDLMGVDCANELCEAIATAMQLATDANETDYLPYLAANWVAVVSNKYFKKWYANRLLWHWLKGESTSKIKEAGLITLSNTDEQYKNGFQQALENERKRLEIATSDYANQGRSRFLSEYWYKNTSLYSCAVLECGCTCTHKCITHCKPKGGLGFKVV
jgi:hypothetical protein